MDTIPSDCPAGFAKLIRDCWSPHDRRPHATKLAKRLLILLQSQQQELVNQPDEKGRTPLINAISQVKIEKVATLLDCKASVHQADSHGWTPLFWARQKDNQAKGITQLLLEAKADPTGRQSKKSMSILPKALSNFFKTNDSYFVEEIEQGNFIKVKYCVEIDGLKPNDSHLSTARKNRQEDIYIYLFGTIYDETKPCALSEYDRGIFIALGIEHNFINFIKYLMQRNLFLDKFPLFHPSEARQPPRMNERGSYIHNDDGAEGFETPSFLACSFGREEIVKLLLENPKIDINGKKIGFYYRGVFGSDFGYHEEWDITPAEAARDNRYTNILQLLFNHAEKYGKKIEMRENQICLIL